MSALSRSEQRKQRLQEIEHEQAAEEAAALRITEDERKLLLQSFASVKVEFCDLDGQRWTQAALRLLQPRPRHHALPPPTSAVTRASNTYVVLSRSDLSSLPPDATVSKSNTTRDHKSRTALQTPSSPRRTRSYQKPAPPGLTPPGPPPSSPQESSQQHASSPLLNPPSSPPRRRFTRTPCTMLTRRLRLHSVLGTPTPSTPLSDAHMGPLPPTPSPAPVPSSTDKDASTTTTTRIPVVPRKSIACKIDTSFRAPPKPQMFQSYDTASPNWSPLEAHGDLTYTTSDFPLISFQSIFEDKDDSSPSRDDDDDRPLGYPFNDIRRPIQRGPDMDDIDDDFTFTNIVNIGSADDDDDDEMDYEYFDDDQTPMPSPTLSRCMTMPFLAPVLST